MVNTLIKKLSMDTTTINTIAKNAATKRTLAHRESAGPMASDEPAGVKWQLACRVEDIPTNGGACVLLDDKQIAIFHFTRRGQWYATENRCPHKQQMALSRGITGSLGPAGEPKVACPFHKKTFSLETGACLSGEDYRIRTYPIKIRNGKVYIGFL
jgi:nitrite reductase (NADH) small subunit